MDYAEDAVAMSKQHVVWGAGTPTRAGRTKMSKGLTSSRYFSPSTTYKSDKMRK
jgi:hypothetical protein